MRFLFRHRDGQTPLPPDYQRDLIPKNIQSFSELDEQEEQNIALGLSWLEKQNGAGIEHLFWRKLHKELFGSVWVWAGKVRKIELQNAEFLVVSKIETAIKQLEGDLKFWIENHSYEPKEIVARFHERILTIHPFPNGNGRFSRILTNFICAKNQLPEPLWGDSYEDQKLRRSDYISAVVEARKKQQYTSLIRFMFS